MSTFRGSLRTGIKTEVQVVYFLAQIRKLIERDQLEKQYPMLKFHCDWALHSRMNRTAAKAILKLFDDAQISRIGNKLVSEPLKSKIERISHMRSFEEELQNFLTGYNLPLLTQNRTDGWTYFLYLYSMVIEDIPLVVSVPTANRKPKQETPGSRPKLISTVIVTCEKATKTFIHANGEEVLFKLTWTSNYTNGQSGENISYNSFSLQHPNDNEPALD
jgi:hypothetical protein